MIIVVYLFNFGNIELSSFCSFFIDIEYFLPINFTGDAADLIITCSFFLIILLYLLSKKFCFEQLIIFDSSFCIIGDISSSLINDGTTASLFAKLLLSLIGDLIAFRLFKLFILVLRLTLFFATLKLGS